MTLIKFFSIAFVSSMLLFSCSDDDKIDINPERVITNKETRNDQNDQDSFGQYHNDYLDFFIARDDFQDGVNRDYLLQITREFYALNDLPYNADESDKIFNKLNDFDRNRISMDDVLSNQVSTICEYIPILCDFGPGPFNPYPFPDFNLMSSGNNTDKVLDFIERAKTLENEIIRSDKFSEEQKMIILQYNAVARYSHQYWHNQEILGNESPWADYIEDDIIELACDTCKEDVKGAIVGAGFGAVVGGVGAGPGAIAGAATASVAQAVSDFIDWLWE